jgi:hypothetical protein
VSCPVRLAFFISLWCTRLAFSTFSKPPLFTTESHLEIKQRQCTLSTRNRSNRKIRTTVHYVGFEVFTAVTMKNAVFWGVAPYRCGQLNRRFGGSYRDTILFTAFRYRATIFRLAFGRYSVRITAGTLTFLRFFVDFLAPSN